MMMMKKFQLTLWLFLVPSVLAKKRGQTIPCSEAIELGFLKQAPDIVNEFGGGDIDGFPCGKYPFDPNVPQETLECNYYPGFDSYECTCSGTTCKQIAAEAMEEFAGENQPCTAEGFRLRGRVRTWWWECESTL